MVPEVTLNERIFSISKRRRDDRRPCRLRPIIGLVLAMLFAVLESVKLRPIAWLATGIVTLLRGLPEILVVLFIYFGSSQLLLTLSDGFTINLGFVQIGTDAD